MIVNECIDALWKNAELGRVPSAQAKKAATIFSGLGIQRIGSRALSNRALEIAISLDHAASDCFYLALAEERMIEIVTADASFVRKVKVSSARHAPVRLAPVRLLPVRLLPVRLLIGSTDA